MAKKKSLLRLEKEEEEKEEILSNPMRCLYTHGGVCARYAMASLLSLQQLLNLILPFALLPPPPIGPFFVVCVYIIVFQKRFYVANFFVTFFLILLLFFKRWNE